MAGDWIQMRVSLTTDPRVFFISTATKSHPAHVIGALHWLWSQADTHTTTGTLHGYTVQQVDGAVGIHGFCEALTKLTREGKPRPWLEIGDQSLRVLRFNEHNGSSAKKRAKSALRQSRFRNAKPVTKSAPTATEQQQQQNSDTAVEIQQPGIRAEHGGSAAAAAVDPDARRRMFMPGYTTVYDALRGFWPGQDKLVRALAGNPNATPERVAWLVSEATAKHKRGEMRKGTRGIGGHIRRGIEEAWDVPTDWLADRQARANAARGGAA